MPAPLRFRVWHEGQMHYPTRLVFDADMQSADFDVDTGRMTGPGLPHVCLEEAGAYIPVGEGGAVVMQSTGVRDLDGREVFEGDIVDVVHSVPFEETEPTIETRGVVVWDDGMACYRVDGRDAPYALVSTVEQPIIRGNIYEHPRILTAE